MRRTIKFRGKRLDNNEWIYGSLMQENGTSSIIADRGFAREYKQVKNNTVGQFTRIVLNGKEVYEDDIVLIEIPACDVCEGGYGVYYKNLHSVFYDEGQGGYFPFSEYYPYQSNHIIDVVGNLHDKIITLDGKIFNAIPDDGNSECNGCALKELNICTGSVEFCQVFQDENHDYHHLELLTDKLNKQ